MYNGEFSVQLDFELKFANTAMNNIDDRFGQNASDAVKTDRRLPVPAVVTGCEPWFVGVCRPYVWRGSSDRVARGRRPARPR